MIGLLLAAQLIAAAPTAVQPLAPGTYTYKATLNGQLAGTTTITVAPHNGGMQLKERVYGAMSSLLSNGYAMLELGPDLSSLSYQASYDVGKHSSGDSAHVARGNAYYTSAAGTNGKFGLPAGATRFLFIDSGTVVGYIPFVAQMRSWNNPTVLVVNPILGSAYATVPNPAAAADRPATVPAGDEGMEFPANPSITIWYNPATNIPDEIVNQQRGVVIVRQP